MTLKRNKYGKREFVIRVRPFRVQYESGARYTGAKRSRMVKVAFGRGAGYVAYRFPGYSRDVAVTAWYRNLSISGRTMTLATYPKDARQPRATYPRFYATGFSRQANTRVYPGNWGF